ncbi:hypothetical protein L218DRAFT_400409 [Marasmius fiardii PR-910]|nr:hypothetical protein L218DRAFT_400409 [Marasmius fiardii PR-910]
MHLLFQSIICQLSLMILDVILMLRVYAIYNKSRGIVSFLVLILLIKLASGIWILSRFRKGASARSISFNYICISTTAQVHEQPGVALFVLGEMAFQGALCWLTLMKTWSLESFWPRAPTLISVLNRDALFVFVAVSGL